MHLTDLLTSDRVAIRRGGEANRTEGGAFDKDRALSILADLLSTGAPSVERAEVERVLVEREHLQSTGIGEGVAIPHGALSQLETQVAALLIAPDGVEFAAIDGHKVTILFAVIGPKRATGEHLKTLARVSRLLRNKAFRDRLVASSDARAAYDLIAAEEAEHK
jgi:PTS system nitrogen regulatory IIA component